MTLVALLSLTACADDPEVDASFDLAKTETTTEATTEATTETSGTNAEFAALPRWRTTIGSTAP